MVTFAVPLLLLFCIAALESRGKKVELSQGVMRAWISQGHSHQEKGTVSSGLRHPQSHFVLQGHNLSSRDCGAFAACSEFVTS